MEKEKFNRKNKIPPTLHAAADGIYITLVIYIIYLVAKTYNIFPGLPNIIFLLWAVILLVIFTASFFIRTLANKYK